MTRLHRAIAAALLGLFLGLVPASVSAQTLTTTYLTAAATATGTTYTVNSGTGIVPGFWIYVDKEAALVTNVSGTTITVQRGSAGMTTAHAVGAAAYIGPIQFFYRANPSSASCAGGTPNIWINVDGGQSFVCSSGLWRNLALMGPGPDGAILVGTGATTPATFTTTIPGTITFDRVLVGDGTAAAPSYSFTSDTDTGSYLVSPNTLGFASAGALQAQVENGAFRLQASTFFAIGNDVILARDAANTLALRNGTNAQTFNICNTCTDASNYERARLRWAGNEFQIWTDAAGTGSARGMALIATGSSGITMYSGGSATGNKVLTLDGNGIKFGSVLFAGYSTPTVSSGFGTSPSVSGPNTAGFIVTVGSGGVATTGVLTMPAASNGWACSIADLTTPASYVTSQTASTTTSVSVANYSRTTGLATAWTAGDVLSFQCVAR